MIIPYFQLKKYNSDHELIKTSRKRRSRSFTLNFLKLLYAEMNQASSTPNDITGTSQTIYGDGYSASYYGCMYSSSMGSYSSIFCEYTNNNKTGYTQENIGIVIGSGTTAVNTTDYKIETIINHGTSAGQLEYLSCGGSALGTSGSTASFDITRIFRNSSGSTITINEIALYCTQTMATSNWNIYPICIVRDILPSGFEIDNGEYMEVVYTLSVTA